MPHLHDRALATGRRQHFVGFGNRCGQWLFDQQVDAVFQQLQTHPMMKPRGRGDDGGIDVADQFVIVGQNRRLAIFLRQPARFGKGIDDGDQFDRLNLLSQPRMNAA